jgi:hypothetical protein
MATDKARKREAVLGRIESLQEGLHKAKEYLESGEHAHWRGFRALFNVKAVQGKELPPHRDWVRNVFVPRSEKALDRAERLLERLS